MQNCDWAQSWHIRFDKIEGFIVYLEYLELEMKKNDFIYNRIRYLTSVKSIITYVISHNFAKF